MELKSYLKQKRNEIEASLEQFLKSKCPSRHLYDPVRYAILAGGKRLRPTLCLAASHTVSGSYTTAMPAACAIEMVHTYSLIHDDLPAIDNDEMRRGQLTCHLKFNEAAAILAGDTLLNMAFEVLSDAGLAAPEDKARLWLRVIDRMGRASGCSGMIEGQARDIANEGKAVSLSELQAIHELKTGALIRAAVSSGAILAGASEAQLEHLDRYAKNIGLAFQVVDDILNITGDPKKLGKAVGTDAERQKNTYPALMGIADSAKFAQGLVDNALQALSIFDNNADPLRELAKYIVERNR